MTYNNSETSDWAERHRQTLTTRHTHEDVLTDREFELLIEACRDLPEPHDLQARFICLAAGRLGLRAGEIAHFQTSWIDWDRSLLRIPHHEPCSCGYCRRQAAQEVEHHDALSTETALADRWHPKTASSARAVPFDLSLRVELCLERFADRYDVFPHSRATVTRRVTAASEQADISGRVYSHCLRATAASYHA
jgi:integrase